MPPDRQAPPRLLLVGNVTRDLDESDRSRFIHGGSVTYAAHTSHALGVAAEAVTRVAHDEDLSDLTDLAHWTVLPSHTTTTFVNQYRGEVRTQLCFDPAAPIGGRDLSPRQRRAEAVFLCPIMQEIASDLPASFAAGTLKAGGAQGWLRHIAPDGRVETCVWPEADDSLSHLDILILSREDLDHDLSRLDPLLARVPIVLLSNHRQGSDLFIRRQGRVVRRHVPPRPAREVDPTGAGDIFATAFLIRYAETGALWSSARFANAAASMGVEGVGASRIPDRRTVLAWLEANPATEPEQ